MPALRLFEASPAWTIEDDALIGFDLSFTRGLRLWGRDLECQPDDALEAFSRQLHDMLCALPDGAIARFVSLELASNDALLAGYRRNFADGALGDYLARKKVEQCTSVLAPRLRELFCFVTVPGPLGFAAYNPGLLGRRAGRMLARARALHHEQLEHVSRLVASLERGLAAGGLRAELLAGDALFAVVWRMANPLHSRRMPPPAYRHDVSLRSQLFASGLLNHFDAYTREGQLNRVVTLKTPPRAVVPTQALELQGLPFEHQLVVTLRRVGDAEAMARVEKNRRQGHEVNRMLAKLRGAARHAEMPDHALAQQQQQVNDVLARLNEGEKLYDVAAQVWFAAPSPDELERRTEVVLARFRAAGQAEAAVEELRGRFAALSLLPGHHSLLGERYHAFLASRAADLVPVYKGWDGAAEPTAVLTTRSGELVGFHPFHQELPAWNATVAGGTGSGKSFATRTLLTGWLARGGRVIIATRGGDYHRYIDVFGGAIQDVALEDPNLALGPFPSPARLGMDEAREVALDHLTSIIALMVAEPGKGLDRLQRRVLYCATQKLYDQTPRDVTPTFRDWLAALETFGRSEPESAALARELGQQMRFWIDGAYGRAFCNNRRDGAAPRLALWNLERIKDTDTIGVVLGLLSGLIAQSIQAGPTVVVLDEVWSLFKSDAGAKLVETLYRTVRKEGSAIWTISQSMNDYVALPDATRSAILNNSPIKLFLAHDGSELATVTSTFQLNERETALLGSLRSVPGQYSELLAFFGAHRQVLRLAPTGIEYWLATSHPKDRDFEQRAILEHREMPRVEILKALARRYPHGALHLQPQGK